MFLWSLELGRLELFSPSFFCIPHALLVHVWNRHLKPLQILQIQVVYYRRAGILPDLWVLPFPSFNVAIAKAQVCPTTVPVCWHVNPNRSGNCHAKQPIVNAALNFIQKKEYGRSITFYLVNFHWQLRIVGQTVRGSEVSLHGVTSDSLDARIIINRGMIRRAMVDASIWRIGKERSGSEVGGVPVHLSIPDDPGSHTITRSQRRWRACTDVDRKPPLVVVRVGMPGDG